MHPPTLDYYRSIHLLGGINTMYVALGGDKAFAVFNGQP